MSWKRARPRSVRHPVAKAKQATRLQASATTSARRSQGERMHHRMQPWHPVAVATQRDRKRERGTKARARSVNKRHRRRRRAPVAVSLWSRASAPDGADLCGLRANATGCLFETTRHENISNPRVLPPAQRTAVKQRPHQETGRQQVATSEPVVHHHGRQGGGIRSRRGAAVCLQRLVGRRAQATRVTLQVRSSHRADRKMKSRPRSSWAAHRNCSVVEYG